MSARITLPAMREHLTTAEMETLRLVAIGMSNAEIAASRSYSIETVKTHMHAVMRKLGTSNRTEAVWQALTRGLINPPNYVPPPGCPTCGQPLPAPPAGYTQ